MIKQVLFDKEARDAVKKGIDAVANAVKVTLGYAGLNVLMDHGYEMFSSTKDGVSVARRVYVRDPAENIGANLIRAAAEKTVADAGDGTTTATLFAQTIINEAIKEIDAGANPVELKKGIDKAVKAVVEKLKFLSREIKDQQTLINIATISANNDKEIGKLIADAVDKVGKDGLITVEESRTTETKVEVFSGMKFDRGLLWGGYVNNQAKMTCEYENPLIIVSNTKARLLKDIQGLIEMIAKTNRPAVIIFDQLDGEANSFIAVNRQKGIINVVPILAPEYGGNRTEKLQDIATLVGAKFVNVDEGMDINKLRKEDCGEAEKVVIDYKDTLIVNGKGDKDKVEARVAGIKTLMESEEDENKKEFLKKRVASLIGGVAVLKVGGVTEPEVREKMDRVDDALKASIAANEEGYLAGGGTSYLHCIEEVQAIIDNPELNHFERKGAEIVSRSLHAPFIQILTNGGVTINKTEELYKQCVNGKYGDGYNLATEKFEDLLEAGVIDPTKVNRCALENAASTAIVFITTQCVISDPSPKE